MSLQGSIVKSVISRIVPRASHVTNTEIEKPQDEEQLFLASIAHLSPDEQVQRTQRRAMYQRMAQRQGIMEVEQRANSYKW
ncbi:MAG: hypothetical protein HY866_21160 [Chloroflexi bacterium]|nr:hypothetical protein [Chloroflexota bacterium]